MRRRSGGGVGSAASRSTGDTNRATVPDRSRSLTSPTDGPHRMGGTDLDITLRNLGVSTIVAIGVSVNVAITNLVMDAVNLAYRVVVPRDAVAGIPTEYAASIIDNTLSLLATVTTTDDLIELWKQS
jgi:nicotinamidase-related amidase